MKAESIAAIDVGSNAIRLLINNVEDYEEKKAIKKNAYIRVPVRLGEDVFKTGFIGQEKKSCLLETMRAFVHLMHVFNVRSYRACGTSAMREALNGEEVAEIIQNRVGLKIDIISGACEAALVYAAGALDEIITRDSTYMHVDVGGGSTEVVAYRGRRTEITHSFPIGTLRILSGTVSPAVKADFENKLRELNTAYSAQAIIASGGNINKTLKLLGKKDGEAVNFTELSSFHRDLSALSFEERLKRYNMNSYRADVIVPALSIFLTIGRICRIKRYIIPKVGLVDGIIRQLYSGELKPRQVPQTSPNPDI